MPDHLKIRVAKDAGFCFGVRDAIEKARDVAREHGKVYMLGDIVQIFQNLFGQFSQVLTNWRTWEN